MYTERSNVCVNFKRPGVLYHCTRLFLKLELRHAINDNRKRANSCVRKINKSPRYGAPFLKNNIGYMTQKTAKSDRSIYSAEACRPHGANPDRFSRKAFTFSSNA